MNLSIISHSMTLMLPQTKFEVIPPEDIETKGLKLGGYHSGPGRYHHRTLVTVITAILKVVSLPAGHTAATELSSIPSDIRIPIKQSSLL